ncbi:hypothetical protein DL98DRAFT_146233 [Cadophora sp. DSE1049]|nr:hypothetical protein DL98DRAFT_146233 [Cadophora sp. DSE1049]
MHIARTILDCKTVAASDRVQGNTYRSVSIRDATVAVDMYLKTKQDVSGESLKRSTLLGYYRAGRRWADLAGSSPLLVFIFSQMAETIVQDNSITDSTVENIAHPIQSHYPGLTEALVIVCRLGSVQHGACTIGIWRTDQGDNTEITMSRGIVRSMSVGMRRHGNSHYL